MKRCRQARTSARSPSLAGNKPSRFLRSASVKIGPSYSIQSTSSSGKIDRPESSNSLYPVGLAVWYSFVVVIVFGVWLSVCPSNLLGASLIKLKAPCGRKTSISTVVGVSSGATTSRPVSARFRLLFQIERRGMRPLNEGSALSCTRI